MRTARSPLHYLPTRGTAWFLTVIVAAATGCNRDVVAPTHRRAPNSSANTNGPGVNWGQRGHVVYDTLVRTFTKREVAAALLARNPGPGALEAFDTVYNVVQYAIHYTTINEKGEPTVASAAVFVPDTTGLRLPLVSFSHGTQTDKHKVPSTLAFINPQGAINATHGSVTVLADYLGTGNDSAHITPYLVADAEAASSLDALRAARAFVGRFGLSLDGRLFLYGYSEGGSVAMALAREIEREPRSGFHVTAVAPMAGAYALYEVGRRALANPTPTVPGSTGAIFVLSAYQAVYHIKDGLDELLKYPYDSLGQVLITTGMPDADANRLFGGRYPRDVIQDAAKTEWVEQPDSRLSQALRANATYEWRPRAPMRLYYGKLDVTVDTLNTTIAAAYMQELGAPVEVVPLAGLNHTAAQWPSYISARRWFDTFPVPTDDGDGENRD
jgi:pimeloyl-ACP methyl ester carboxylesterase